MKFFAIATLAVVAAQEEEAAAEAETVEYGADCMETMVCDDETLECVSTADEMGAFCQDCMMECRMWDDMTEFVCAADEMEASNSLAASAMAILAAAAMMA